MASLTMNHTTTLATSSTEEEEEKKTPESQDETEKKTSSGSQSQRLHRFKSVERLGAYSDAVFSIVITFMVSTILIFIVDAWNYYYVKQLAKTGRISSKRQRGGHNTFNILRSIFVKTDWVRHIWCNFKSGYTCRTTAIFETLKDDK